MPGSATEPEPSPPRIFSAWESSEILTTENPGSPTTWDDVGSAEGLTGVRVQFCSVFCSVGESHDSGRADAVRVP